MTGDKSAETGVKPVQFDELNSLDELGVGDDPAIALAPSTSYHECPLYRAFGVGHGATYTSLNEERVGLD